jgi:hypothetical protein
MGPKNGQNTKWQKKVHPKNGSECSSVFNSCRLEQATVTGFVLA